MNLLQQAQRYLSMGWSVIPIERKSKLPALKSWKEFQQRLPTQQELQTWFVDSSNLNIAIITGLVSKLVVIDVDTMKVPTDLLELKLVSPISVKTGKGKHFYFRSNESIPSRTRIFDNVDIRADGGYVVAPPSIHDNGTRYYWIISPVKHLSLPLFPENAKEIFKAKKEEIKNEQGWISKALEGMKNGNRDETLFRICSRMRVDGYSSADTFALLKLSAEKVDAVNILQEKINNVWGRYDTRQKLDNREYESYRQRTKPKIYSPRVQADWERYCERRKRESSFQDPELPFGFANIDKTLGGLRRGEVYTIGARTGVGKTCFCINISKSILANSKRVLFLSTEMSYESIWERLRQSFGNNQLSNDEFKSFDWFVSDAGNISETEVKQMIDEVKPDVLILDHIQHLGSTITNRAQELGLFIKNLKNMAREYDIAIIVASQLNRGAESINLKTGERIKPQIYHLAECGGIENESAVVMLLSKEYQIDDDHDMYNLNICKNRYGSCGTFNIIFDRKTTRMYEE